LRASRRAAEGAVVPTILIADDSGNVRKVARDLLEEQGYKVVEESNGEAAVRRLNQLTPDLVLVDIFMPVRNGYEVCEFIKKEARLAHVPVILLQGAFDLIDEHEIKRVGADDVLKKPFVPAEPMIGLVKSMLARSAKAQAAAAPPVGATVMLTREEIARLTGQAPQPPPAPEPEPEVAEEYAIPQQPQIEIQAENQPAFSDLLEAEPQAVEAAPAAEEPAPALEGESFLASSVAHVEVPAETPEEEAARIAIEYGGITEEQKQPSPDEPPIKVEFGSSEPAELVTYETGLSEAAAEVAPLPELAGSAAEWMAPAPAAPPAELAEAARAPAAPAVAAPAPEPAPAAEEFAVAEPAPVPIEEPAALAAPPVEIPAEPAAAPAAAAPAVAYEAAPRVDEALVNAVVEKVLARLEPRILEHVAREIVRPLAEALLRRELEKSDDRVPGGPRRASI
jgi:CheY-like chemotaxis protein